MTFVNSTNSGSGSPVFDYSSRDYSSILSDLLTRIPVYMPEWTSTSASDFGIVMLQMFAYMGDILGYYLDRLAGEAFIQTATQPSSILNLAAMLGYTPALSAGATGTITVSFGTTVIGPISLPAGTQFATQSTPTQSEILFQTTQTVVIAGAGGATPSFTAQVPIVQGQTYTSLPSAYGSIDLWDEFNIPSTAVVVPQVAVSNGAINQTYPFLYSPVSADSFSIYVDLGLGPQEWTYVTNLISAAPNDYVYTNFVDANGNFYVIFGDGVNGYVPPLGSPIYATYQTNVGSLGNVGSGTITVPASAIVGLVSVTNASNCSGGSDAESIASIQQNAPASLRSLDRGVTVNDIETLALVSGVQWTSVVEETYQLVNLYVAPQGGGIPSPGLQANILNYLQPLVMPNTTVSIFPPTYVPIDITLELVVLEPYGNTSTQNLVQNALQNLFQLVNTGFGFRVALGFVYQVILSQPGVDYAIVSSMNRQFDAVLNVALTTDTTYTSLTVTPLPQPVYGGDVVTLTNSLTTTLTSVLIAGTVYTQILIAGINQALVQGDTLVLVSPNGGIQEVTLSSGTSVGQQTVLVTAFPAAYNFQAGTFVTDVTVAPNTQTSIVVTGSPDMIAAPAGSTAIPVNFTTTAAFSVGTYVQDLTGADDCVLLDNEIPVLGIISFSPPTTGGLLGS